VTIRFEPKKATLIASVKQAADRLSRRLGWIAGRQSTGAASGRR
jgi:hypothetical protein